MADFSTHVIESLGYLGILLLMFLENVFPPIPSELIMPAAGFAASRGQLSLPGVILAGTAGSVLGAIPLYYLGHLVGQPRLTRWTARHGHYLALSPNDLTHANEWFNQHRSKAVLLCRLIPGVRSLISIPAGINQMNLPQFLLYTAIGSAAWTTALALAGKLLEANYTKVQKVVDPLTYLVLGLIVTTFVVRAIRLKRQQSRTSA
jgi:membrane protein DedA with SNARE-associated domain